MCTTYYAGSLPHLILLAVHVLQCALSVLHVLRPHAHVLVAVGEHEPESRGCTQAGARRPRGGAEGESREGDQQRSRGMDK